MPSKLDHLRRSALSLALPAICACGASDPRAARPGERDAAAPRDGSSDARDGGVTPPVPATPLAPAFCERPADDGVRDVFCAGAAPSIAGLSDLHRLLRIPTDPTSGLYVDNAATFLGHSTSLAGHLVSPLNPRAIVPSDQKDVFVAFQRGAQQVELAARARDGAHVNLYLLTFRQACNDAPDGCRPGDLYTPAIERDWRNVTLRDDEELANTPSDCRQCHRRGVDGATLLMRELQSPWTHFFSPEGDPRSPVRRYGISGALLTTEYLAAKGDEPYAACAPEVLQRTFGGTLEIFVGPEQPLLFDAPNILAERFPQDVPDWPGTPQRSPTWDREYEAFKRGDHLPLPYFDAHATDPEKQRRLTEAYANHRAGALAAADLPDLAEVFPDDPQTRAEIGLETEPQATAPEALVQACGTCHNDVLDQSISRARFNVDVARLPREELDRAIDRLTRPLDAAGAMPPPDARRLGAAVRDRLVAYLRQAAFPESDRVFLEHAASAGMARPAGPRPVTVGDAGYTLAPGDAGP